jgi:hypothetical protein
MASGKRPMAARGPVIAFRSLPSAIRCSLIAIRTFLKIIR